jgi:hypothetical protein
LATHHNQPPQRQTDTTVLPERNRIENLEKVRSGWLDEIDEDLSENAGRQLRSCLRLLRFGNELNNRVRSCHTERTKLGELGGFMPVTPIPRPPPKVSQECQDSAHWN